ncbi:hypothetical protein GpartN1_g2770.t1 [Galdieria partita]|uniref:Uncharacterized protein n=1 Tax=Galdieria partita TaxID=83374 RepID=A0A9C7PV23_9RHOD|nr:hypothetical protein GpartN1_g2770.t1 [Galdieria partita]
MFAFVATTALAIQGGILTRNAHKKDKFFANSPQIFRGCRSRGSSISPCMTFNSVPLGAAHFHEQLFPVVNRIAASESDFGGYTGPIIGLLTIFALIIFLSPPLKE